MAGGQERILRRRIKSVQNTKKITKAMELIAASRIVRSQQRVAAARPYAEQITNVIGNLAGAGAEVSSPLLQVKDNPATVAFLVITGDRGLAGAYNSNVIRLAEREIRAAKAAGQETRLVVIGKKAQSYFRFRGEAVDASFVGMTDLPTYENAREVASFVTERFESGEYEAVQLVYTQFFSVGTQRVVSSRFMPLDRSQLEAAPASEGPKPAYEFEPEPGAILERLLPRYAEARLFAALLDASASEHANRQRAMKSATDNADDLITRLSRIMNRARQDSITSEIMEIVGGAEALSADKGSPVDLLIDRMFPPDLFEQHDHATPHAHQ